MNKKIALLTENIEKVIIGKHEVVLQVLAALLSGGHILIEDVPGVGKTQLVAALAKSVDGKFNRIQLTPDVMPSDITGFSMVDGKSGEFRYREGAAMCNFLLADEINRASPKAQSSLLEIMEEFQISLDGQTHPLPKPFMVLATQNPVETYGTYHLPEAQMDRFLMRVSMGYPTEEEEMRIIDREASENAAALISPVLAPDDITALRAEAMNVRLSPAVKRYIMNIVSATRSSEMIKLGASPRGSISLGKAARAHAFIEGRAYAIPDDIKAMACPVLAHRVMLSQKGKSELGSQEAVIRSILGSAEVPLEG